MIVTNTVPVVQLAEGDAATGATRRLVGRLEDVEIAGPVERLAASFVPVIEHLPLRCRLAAC